MSVNTKIRQAAKILSCLVLIISILCGVMAVYAEDPYRGYNYNFYGEAPSPNGYLPSKSYNGYEWGIGYLKDPSDVYVKNEFVYILDAGNGRIIKTDANLNLITVISNFTLNGVPSPLSGPQGICVTSDGEIYICDTNNARVIVTDETGVIRREYGKPKTDQIADNIAYRPKKVEVTMTGDMYILADNIVDGAIVITEKEEFLGFFATDAVTITSDAAKVVFWRLIMSEEQKKKMMSLQPVPFDNMYLDGDFLYTTTVYTREKNQIRKINPAGKNLYDGMIYGEAYNNVGGKGYEQAKFVDVNVDENGFFYGLDQNFCKIFMYNQENELLMIFGGNGDVEGQFKIPVAIESVGGKVIVLDAGKNSLTAFEPTYYGQQIMLGSYMYEHGKYEEAREPWNEVLKLNTNSEIAYRGIARSEYLSGDYVAAMKHYEAAYDIEGYSEARQRNRSKVLSENFTLFMSVILVIVIALVVLNKNKQKIYAKIGYQTLAQSGYAGMKKWKYPFYNLIHPYDGMNEMNYNKKESLPLAVLFAFAWYASAVIIRQYEDYIFNPTNKNQINIFMVLATTIGLMLIGCLANWAITTLVEGKGTFRNIFIYCSYSMIPSTIAAFIVTIISHFMISGEAVFVQGILLIGYAWTALLMFIGMQTVHKFTTKKALLMTLLTAVGMIIILFLMMLMVVLYSQVASFITTVMYEIFYKFAV